MKTDSKSALKRFISLPKFKEGDFIEHIDPYDGEGEEMVIEVDVKRKTYKLAKTSGKHKQSNIRNGLQIMPFEVAHEFYNKVG